MRVVDAGALDHVVEGDLGKDRVQVVVGLDITDVQEVTDIQDSVHLSTILSHGKGVGEGEQGIEGGDHQGLNLDLEVVIENVEEIKAGEEVDRRVDAEGGAKTDIGVIGVGDGCVEGVAKVSVEAEGEVTNLRIFDQVKGGRGVRHDGVTGGNHRGSAGNESEEDLSHLFKGCCFI